MNEIEQDIRKALMSPGERRFKLSRVANWLINYPDENNSVYIGFDDAIRKGCEIAEASKLLKMQAELLREYDPHGDGKFSITAIYKASLAQGGGALTDLIREVERKRKESGYVFCQVCIDDSTPAPSSSGTPDVAMPEVVSERHAGRHRGPTVQQEIAPYVAQIMAAHPDYTADRLYAHMKREPGQDNSPFSRPAPGGELFCPEAGKPCGRSSVVSALTAYNKERNRPRSTVEVP